MLCCDARISTPRCIALQRITVTCDNVAALGRLVPHSWQGQHQPSGSGATTTAHVGGAMLLWLACQGASKSCIASSRHSPVVSPQKPTEGQGGKVRPGGERCQRRQAAPAGHLEFFFLHSPCPGQATSQHLPGSWRSQIGLSALHCFTSRMQVRTIARSSSPAACNCAACDVKSDAAPAGALP